MPESALVLMRTCLAALLGVLVQEGLVDQPGGFADQPGRLVDERKGFIDIGPVTESRVTEIFFEGAIGGWGHWNQRESLVTLSSCGEDPSLVTVTV